MRSVISSKYDTLVPWGRYPHHPQVATQCRWQDQIAPVLTKYSARPTLAFGNGRSYGDSCLSASDVVLHMTGLNRVIEADWATGRVVAQSGLLLDELIQLALPRGWFLPVTPGTRFVTLGGAVANDVHGKNHHQRGTFGCHIQRMEVIRSDAGRQVCSPKENPELFAATVGGLGLTGIISWIELQLRSVRSSMVDTVSHRFSNLGEFFSLSDEHDKSYEYAVAWIDCLAKGRALGRGLYMLGDHAPEGGINVSSRSARRFPVDPPISLVNRWSVRLFNELYYRRQRQDVERSRVSFLPYFYPLDAILDWNRVYGRRGFQQYQCLVPEGVAPDCLKEILLAIAQSKIGSSLAVLKRFGDVGSPGWLSFPGPGTTLALDFPRVPHVVDPLFSRLDTIIREAGGRLYPAKDAHMTGADFRQAYPAWERLEALRDPALCSRFWKRVTQ